MILKNQKQVLNQIKMIYECSSHPFLNEKMLILEEVYVKMRDAKLCKSIYSCI